MSAPRKTRTPVRMAKIRQHLAAGCPSFHGPDGLCRPCDGIGCQLNLGHVRRSTGGRKGVRR